MKQQQFTSIKHRNSQSRALFIREIRQEYPIDNVEKVIRQRMDKQLSNPQVTTTEASQFLVRRPSRDCCLPLYPNTCEFQVSLTNYGVSVPVVHASTAAPMLPRPSYRRQPCQCRRMQGVHMKPMKYMAAQPRHKLEDFSLSQGAENGECFYSCFWELELISCIILGHNYRCTHSNYCNLKPSSMCRYMCSCARS